MKVNKELDDSLKRLVLNDSGFVFDPMMGHSFTVNPSGLALLKLMQKQKDIELIKHQILHDFDVSTETLERDVVEFNEQLKRYLK
ncbi:MAG: PqqD family protein [Methylococcales bacterium]|nr:PqqD family protein [Methylococcales bacterium]MDD5754616.1 PqqD family protein [Methylococcales bacterium]